MKANCKVPLPFMKTMEDALAVCQRENDNFYLTAFMLEAWLGEVVYSTIAQYAERKAPQNRKLQRGLASDSFSTVLGRIPDAEFIHLFESLCRFGEFDDPQSRMIADAFRFSSQESPVSTWPVVTPPVNADQLADGVAFMRRFVSHLGEWLEGITHSQVHLMSCQIPLAFDPGPEKRELALLGYQQREYPAMPDFSESWWQWLYAEAAERLSDPSNWAMLGKSMADGSTPHQNVHITRGLSPAGTLRRAMLPCGC